MSTKSDDCEACGGTGMIGTPCPVCDPEPGMDDRVLSVVDCFAALVCRDGPVGELRARAVLIRQLVLCLRDPSRTNISGGSLLEPTLEGLEEYERE